LQAFLFPKTCANHLRAYKNQLFKINITIMNFIAPIRNNTSFVAPLIANISVATDKNPYYHQLQQDFVKAVDQQDTISAAFFHQKMEKDLQDKFNELTPGVRLTVTKTLGIWEGGLEPSFQLKVQEPSSYAMNGIINASQHFQQDSVHFLRPVALSGRSSFIREDANQYMFSSVKEFKLKQPISISHLQQLLGKCGLGGAQCSTDAKHITIYNALTGEQLACKLRTAEASLQWSVSAELFAKSLENIQRTSFTDAFFTSYGSSTYSAIKTYDQRSTVSTLVSNNVLSLHSIQD
jgi:hypothetical protein